MNKELILLIFEIEVEVGKSYNILIDKFAYLSNFDGSNSIIDCKAAVIPNDLWRNLVDFVLEQQSIHCKL